MKKKPSILQIILGIFGLFIVVALVITIVSLNSGEATKETYKITYDSKKLISDNQDTISNYKTADEAMRESGGGMKEYNVLNSIASKVESYDTFEADYGSDAAAYEEAPAQSYESYEENYEENYEEINSDISTEGNDLTLEDLKVQGDYLKWTYDSLVETTEYDSFVGEIAKAVSEAGGYVEDAETLKREYQDSAYSKSYEVRRGIYTIRIPQESVESLEEVLNTADVQSSHNYCEDITTSYLDTETKLEYLGKEHDKLQALALEATDIQDILAINDRVTAIEQELEFYNKLMEQLKKDVKYATYYLTIDEVKYYDDTVVKYKSEILENWSYVARDWIEEVIPEAFFLLITIIPFIIVIVFALYKLAKKKIDYTIKKQFEFEQQKKSLSEEKE